MPLTFVLPFYLESLMVIFYQVNWNSIFNLGSLATSLAITTNTSSAPPDNKSWVFLTDINYFKPPVFIIRSKYFCLFSCHQNM